MSSDSVSEVAAAILSRLAARGWIGYDPFDALASPCGHRLMARRRIRLARALTQTVKRSPVLIQPILRTPPLVMGPTLGYALQAVSDLNQARALADASAFANRLTASIHSLGLLRDGRLAWGLPFAFVTRFGVTPGNAPNVVSTEVAVSGLVRAYHARLLSDTRDIDAALRFIGEELSCEYRGRVWFRYTPTGGDEIINGCALAVKAILRAHDVSLHSSLAERAIDAACSISELQNDDGSWPYSTDSRGGWVDGFHTGFVLEALCLAYRASEPCRETLRPALLRGLHYYRTRLLGADGRAYYYQGRAWPLDAMCAAQAIQTLCTAHEVGMAALDDIQPVVSATLRMFTAPDGRVAYRVHRSWTDWREFPRWSAAPVAAALARYAALCTDQNGDELCCRPRDCVRPEASGS